MDNREIKFETRFDYRRIAEKSSAFNIYLNGGEGGARFSGTAAADRSGTNHPRPRKSGKIPDYRHYPANIRI